MMNCYKNEVKRLQIDIDEQGLLGRATSDREVKCLYSLAKDSRQGAIVEIGSWKGRSTVYLAKGAEANGQGNKVYAIDPHLHNTETIFKDNMKRARVNHIVVPIIMRSEDAVKQWSYPISLLFIDGAHDFESTRRDFMLWEPYVIGGGQIAFHDKFAEGPCKVIRSSILKSNAFSSVGVTEGVLFAEKVRGRPYELAKMWLLVLSYIATMLAVLTRSRRFHKTQRIFGKVGMWLSERI